MMKSIYEVKTKKWKTYYVMAMGFDDAKNKVENTIADEDTNTILDEDGSLKNDYKPDEVVEIKCLSNEIIE